MRKKQLINTSIKLVTYIFLILVWGSSSGFSSEKYKDFLQLSDQKLSETRPTFNSQSQSYTSF